MRGRTALVLVVVLAALILPPPAVRATPAPQASVVHTVQRGETLFSIARRYGVSVDAVSGANGIGDPSRIYAGQRLVIPIPATENPADSSASLPAAAGATHTVQPGENLYRIALRHGTTVQALAQINGLYNPRQIYVGQVLRIPGSAAAPTVGYQAQHAASTHTVQRGETLSAIASRYGVSLWTLVQVNGIANPGMIFPGQVLSIPGASGQVATAVPAPPAGGGKRIVIDISEQHLYAYQGDTLAYSFVASTGKPGAGTRTGSFSVLTKIPNAYASTWSLQMPHWLGIYWAGSLQNGIHALPIMANGQRLWAGYLGTPVSFGCIILGVEEPRLLYQWAEIGTPVTIRY
jgi:LysM repeat protein